MTATNKTEHTGLLPRAWRFLHKPRPEKARSFHARWVRIFPNIPLPVRLPFGAWWLARNDFIASSLFCGGFEISECSFVESLLRPGMVVLDIGAHNGLYTLLASKCVGPNGRVFAFEPSPRERKALRWNIRLNRCKNVVIEDLALGNGEGEDSLYVVQGHETGCNSLRPPALSGITTAVPVRVNSLDQWLTTNKVKTVDFIKLDVEGGELSVLQGAQRLLESAPRPVILAEVQDIRTKPWDYPAREIIRHLSSKGYKWFSLTADGAVSPLDVHAETFDGNFVAIPGERLDSLGGIAVPSWEIA
jgi:FkbM family methyltransferase